MIRPIIIVKKLIINQNVLLRKQSIEIAQPGEALANVILPKISSNPKFHSTGKSSNIYKL